MNTNLSNEVECEEKEDYSLGIKGVDYLKPNTLDEETKNRIAFVTFIIEKFASGYKMNRREAYLYLEKYGGLDYIFENWWALHIDNPFWALRDIYKVCRHNGGDE